MTDQQVITEWTGIRGRMGAWYLNSPLRRLSEILFLGDCKAAFLSELSRLKGDEVVLDVGAGSGYFSLAIARRLSTGQVLCLDLSAEMLRRLERKAESQGLNDRIQILNRAASSTGLETESVDWAVSNGVFHELSNSEVVLMEMLRVLKPNGKLIITDFSNTWIGRRIGAAHRPEAHGPLSVAELKTLFAKAGLKEVKVRPVKHWVIGVGKK